MFTRRHFTRGGLALLGSLALPHANHTAAADSSVTALTVPPDLPLPNSGASQIEWIRETVIVQPWADTQFKFLVNAGDRARRLQEEFGFNAMIVLPTQAHNALCDFVQQPQSHLTDAQFREGVDVYRQAGYRLILYSSVMHCGHAPVWQSGELGREHPDWLQRDKLGNPITRFGNASWLCGSSPARDYTLHYTLRLLHDYSPDGFMLDNCGFGHTEAGWTCYCGYCQRGFRKYVLARCGEDWIKSQLSIGPRDLQIPTEPGPLFALWTNWRNRLWAEIDELFRARLREINPQILLFANTQYDLPVDTQASSLQFQHEDIVFSETHEVDPWYISQKMVLGKALASGIPLWDYMGTFAETPQNPALDQLRPWDVLRQSIPPSLAHGARPWIVYLGFEDPGSQSSLHELGHYLSWFASHPDLFVATPKTPVGAMISLRTRDILALMGKCVGQGVTGCSVDPGRQYPLTPPHLEALLKAGVPAVGLADTRLSPHSLLPFQVVTMESGLVMTPEEVNAMATWVRSGGFVITIPEAGRYDELGQKRDAPLLLETLQVASTLGEVQRIGKGKALIADPNGFGDAVLAALKLLGIPFVVPAGAEVVCYRSPGKHIIHLLRNDAEQSAGALRFPSWLGARTGPAEWFSPDWTGARSLAIEADGECTTTKLPEVPFYSVLALNR